MTFKTSLADRRSVIGRLVMNLTNKKGPLSQEELAQLRVLRAEMDTLEDDIALDHARRYRAAFANYLRRGFTRSIHANGVIPGITAEEQQILREGERGERRDLGTGGESAYPNALSGFFVPTAFSGLVESAMKDVGPMLDRDLVTIWDTATGAPLGYPTDNDTTVSGEATPEESQATDQDVAGLSQTILKSYKFDSKLVKVSIELLQDTGFDLEAYLSERFGVRLARILNLKFTLGTGSGEPTGFINSAGGAGTAVGAGTNDGTSGANTLGQDDFATLEASVDPAYRRSKSCAWMLHASTLAAVRKVKSKDGLPAFPGLHHGGQDEIFNYPVRINPNMDQLQSVAGSPPVTRNVLAFGDWSKYVVRRPAPMLLRLTERFIDYGQVAFLMHWRHDGALIDGGGGAVKVLQTIY